MRSVASLAVLGACLLVSSCGEAPEVAWPISGSSAPDADLVTSPFGPRDQGGSYDFHAGIDFPVAEGTKVRAIKAGVVEKIENHDGGTGPGNWVLIDHGDGEKSSYLHLSKFSTKAGATVDAGEVIGRSGSTGSSSPHLHLTYMVGVTGKGADESVARNPLELLAHTDMPIPEVSFGPEGGSDTTVHLEMVAQPMTVQSIDVEIQEAIITLDYADIVALGNPDRDEQVQSGIRIEVSKVEDGRFSLDLTSETSPIDHIVVRDYAGEIVVEG